MLADRVRMGSGGRNDLLLYDKGKIYAKYGRTKDFFNSSGASGAPLGEGVITFNSDYFHMYIWSVLDITIRTMVGFKLPPNLPANAKIRVKYFDCDGFYVSLAPSIDFLNSREELSRNDTKNLRYLSGTGETILELGDTTGYEVIGVMSSAYWGYCNNRFEELEVII